MDQAAVIEKLKRYRALVAARYRLRALYLFGSYARGTQHEDSDIDVAVVVDGLDGDYFTYTPPLWQMRSQIDARIEPVLFEYDKDPSGFLEEIVRTGIEITA